MNSLKSGLTNNFIKIIAIISMTIDHIGLIIMDDYTPFRIIGRLAFPIFAYFISEGCFFTRNIKKYFMQLLLVGVISQIIYTSSTGEWYLNILLTFSFSILLIYLFDKLKEYHNGTVYSCIVLLVAFFIIFFLEEVNVNFDYGFIGIITPLVIYNAPTKQKKILCLSLILVLMSINFTGNYVQFFSLFSIPILYLYNGERGKYNLKLFFYLFYPVHLGVLHLISIL